MRAPIVALPVDGPSAHNVRRAIAPRRGRDGAHFSASVALAAYAYVSDVTTPKQRSLGIGAVMGAFGGSFVVGPLVAAAINKHYGEQVTFVIASVLYAVGLL